MPRELVIPDLDDLIALYERGTPMRFIARDSGISEPTLIRHMRNRGVHIRSQREAWQLRPRGVPVPKLRKPVPELPALISRYEGGESLKHLADMTGHSRTLLARAFREAGVTLRRQSESERVKWETLGRDRARVERQMSKAWAAVRGAKRGDDELAMRAAVAERLTMRVYRHEQELADMLRARGLDIAQQVAVGKYNVDIAHRETGVAVEVLGSQVNLIHRPDYAERTEHILDAGWFVLFVDLRYWRSGFDYARICDQVVAFAQLAGPSKALRGQYGVIGRYGEPIPKPRKYLPRRPSIFGPHAA